MRSRNKRVLRWRIIRKYVDLLRQKDTKSQAQMPTTFDFPTLISHIAQLLNTMPIE